MHQLVPTFILQKADSGEHYGKMIAAVMFADLSGFSTMSDTLGKHGHHGSEILAYVMRAVFEPLVNGVYAQGGFVVGFSGDALTAIFLNDDTSSPGLRCLSAAAAIRKHFAENPVQKTSFNSFPISVKIGLSFGETIWEIFHSSNGYRATYCFRGRAMDNAAKAEHRASPGEIWLDDSLYQAVESHVTGNLDEAFFKLNAFNAELSELQFPDVGTLPTNHLPAFFSESIINLAQRGEFRPMVNVFIDIRMDDQQDDQFGSFIKTVFALQERFGGFFLRPEFGDKGTNLLIFWGAPMANENDIERALNFLFELQKSTDVPFSAGVSYRLAYAGFIGADLREDYTGYGWGISLAARMMKSAAPGEIWVDGEVVHRENRHFNFSDPEEREFKGFGEKQKVYILLGRKVTIEKIYNGLFEGRGNDLGRLTDFLAPLWDKRFAGIMVVKGDAGIGKSRLIHEFMNSAVFDHYHAQWAFCQTDEIVRKSFNPFRYWLRRRFKLDESMNEEDKKKHFLKQIELISEIVPYDDLTSELTRTSSFLGALLDIFWDGSLYSQLEAEERYQNTVIALSVLICCDSLQNPLILHIEDFHLVDSDTYNFIPQLARILTADESRQYPVAILATARPEVQLRFGSENRQVHELLLEGLEPEALSRMASDLLGGLVSEGLVDFLSRRAEGNPFFAEQVLKYLKENNLLEERDGFFNILKSEQVDLLSTDIQSILVARLDCLTRDVKEVVQSAAVLGREFEIRLLIAMLDDQPLLQLVQQAERADIWIPLNEIRYIFKHALMRDAAYSMQLRSRQRQMHRLAVNSMEKLYAGDLSPHYGELAYHADRAFFTQKAPIYLELAGDSACEQYQNAQALDYYNRALGYISDTDLEKRFHLHLCRENILSHWDQRGEQKKELDVLLTLAKAIGDNEKLSEARLRRANYLLFIGDYQLAAELSKETLKLSEEAGRYDLTCEGYLLLCSALSHQGKFDDAINFGNIGIEMAREHGFPTSEARLLNTIGNTMLEYHPANASSYLIRAQEIFRKTGDLRNLVMPLNNLGNLAGLMGDFVSAQKYYEDALNIGREVGNRKSESILLGNLGWIAGLMGDYRKARSLGERNLLICRQVGERYTETYTLINLSAYSGVLGDDNASLRYAEQGLELAGQSGDVSGEAWALTFLGHAFFALDQFERAKEIFLAATRIRLELGQPALETEPAAGLARTALKMGDVTLAREVIERVLETIQKNGKLDVTDQPVRVYLNCYLVLDEIKDNRAGEVLDQGYELLNGRAAGIEDAAARHKFLIDVPFHKEILMAWKKRHHAA